MPLIKSGSSKAMHSNIKELMKSGHPQKQSIAASLANQRKYKKMFKGGEAEYEKEYYDEEMREEQHGYNSGGKVDHHHHDAASHPHSSLKKNHPYKEVSHMANGGMVQDVDHGGMDDMDYMVAHARFKGGRDEPLSHMDKRSPEGYKRSLNEIREDGEYYPEEISNPNEQNEMRMFAHALRKRAESRITPEDFGPLGDGYAHGGLVQEDGAEEDERQHGAHPRLDWIDDGTAEPMSSMPYKPDGLEHSMNVEPKGNGLSIEAKEAISRKKKSRRYGIYDPRNG